MRFRLATKPPLRPLRAWFDITSGELVPDILTVKSQLCSRLPQLVDENGTTVSPAKINLFIDDFELLDDSSLEVIKENDLVYITRRQDDSLPNKRKTANDHRIARKKRRIANDHPIKTERGPPQSSSSEDETESSDSDSSTTSSSESSSSSSSSSTSSSSGSSIEVQSSKLLPSVRPLTKKSNDRNLQHAPPGQGKPTTHSRNARRRIKRLYEKQQKQLAEVAAQSIACDSANAVPLGTKNNNDTEQLASNQDLPHISPPTEHSSPVEVENLVTAPRNKNKKKGFKQAMAGLTPQKILFTDSTPPESTSTFYSTASNTTIAPIVSAPRLVTPSEKQAQGFLLPNVFVTSVEVESEAWDKRRKGKQRNGYGNSLVEEGAVTGTVEEIVLDYGKPEIDWTVVEKNWDTMAALSDISSLKEGAVVGWKALAINPATYTPETLVHLGRVKAVNTESSSVFLEPVRRPGALDIAFGLSARTGESEDGVSKEESIADEVYTFDDVLKAAWKVVNI